MSRMQVASCSLEKKPGNGQHAWSLHNAFAIIVHKWPRQLMCFAHVEVVKLPVWSILLALSTPRSKAAEERNVQTSA